MNLNKKKVAILTGAFLLSLALTACGNDGDTDEVGNNTEDNGVVVVEVDTDDEGVQTQEITIDVDEEDEGQIHEITIDVDNDDDE